MPKPPFAEGRVWHRRASNASAVGRRVWYDPDDGYEYEPDPNPARGTWHQIDARAGLYRDVDPDTGAPIAGSEGEWRSLRSVVVSATSPTAIRIAMCATIDELHACEDLQGAVWGGGEREIIPYDIMRAILHAGGTVLGAWDGERLVGIALSIVGWRAAGAYHHSHLLGVLPEYRHHNLGMRLKLAQREFVLAQGFDLITWTFDPLESANAHLNFAKLGVVSDTYLPDFYGAMPEALNAGLPSDRLLVEWRLNAPHVLGRLATGAMGTPLGPLVPPDVYDAPFVLRMAHDGSPVQTPLPASRGGRGVGRLRIEIPASIQAIKARDPARALAWRMATRAALTGALAAGYLVTDYRAPRFHRPEAGCYVLAHTDPPASLP